MFALADCNNFFVSCERVFRPDLEGRPVIVLSNNDGCAVSRSNEAKALGIKMGAPLFKIRGIVEQHHVAVFSGNYALYGDMSRRVQEVLRSQASSVEVYSIDEAFLDLRGAMIDDFDTYAKRLSALCRKLTGIPVSVGVAPTKTLAKIASKLCKQYPKLRGGCYLHRPANIEKVLRKFPVQDVWGIGRRSRGKLTLLGVSTAWDYAQLREYDVRKNFALPGWRTWRELRGIPCIEFEDYVEPRQHICVSRSFAKEIDSMEELCSQVATFADQAVTKLRGQGSLAMEMAIFAMTNRFHTEEPQNFASQLVVFPDGTDDHRTVVLTAADAARRLFNRRYKYKKAGVLFTRIVQKDGFTPSIFRNVEAGEKEGRLSQAMDVINGTFGTGTIRLGIQGDGKVHSAHEFRSPCYTTRWAELPKVRI